MSRVAAPRVRVVKDADVAAEFELGPGAVVGEMSLMTGAPRSATVTVTVWLPSTVAVLLIVPVALLIDSPDGKPLAP